MEKATLLKGFICLRVCFSLFTLSSLSFMTAPFSLSNSPERQAGEGGVRRGEVWGGMGVWEKETEEGSFEGERAELKTAGVGKEVR